MSIIYCLANHKTKELYELGKGPWYEFNYYPEILLYKEEIIKLLEDYFLDDPEKEELDPYWFRIIDHLWNWIKDHDPEDLEVVSEDDVTELKFRRYTYTGLRYYLDKTSEDYQKELNHRNEYKNNTRLWPIVTTPYERKKYV